MVVIICIFKYFISLINDLQQQMQFEGIIMLLELHFLLSQWKLLINIFFPCHKMWIEKPSAQSLITYSICFPTVSINAVQYNTIQYNTIQYNTIKAWREHLLWLCLGLGRRLGKDGGLGLLLKTVLYLLFWHLIKTTIFS